MDIDQLVGVINLMLTSVNVGLMVAVIYAIRSVQIEHRSTVGRQVGAVWSDGKAGSPYYALRPDTVPVVEG